MKPLNQLMNLTFNSSPIPEAIASPPPAEVESHFVLNIYSVKFRPF